MPPKLFNCFSFASPWDVFGCHPIRANLTATFSNTIFAVTCLVKNHKWCVKVRSYEVSREWNPVKETNGTFHAVTIE